MTPRNNIGPLVCTAIADAYGSGFEFAHRHVKPGVLQKRNNLSRYWPHPKWGKPPQEGEGFYIPTKPGCYTDDTQMALGLCEHMLEDGPWTPLALADRWVGTFCRDPRPGYSAGFYNILQESQTGMDLLTRIVPLSDRNGGAMRAWPLGFLPDPTDVRQKAFFQATLTHATEVGTSAAVISALMFHYCYYNIGPRRELPQFLKSFGLEPRFDWRGHVPTDGWHTVRAVGTVLLQGGRLSDVLMRSVDFGGDTDTVAAMAMACASVCPDLDHDLPHVLQDTLESGLYGRAYLQDIGEKLLAKFPRGQKAGDKGSPVEEKVQEDNAFWNLFFEET